MNLRQLFSCLFFLYTFTKYSAEGDRYNRQSSLPNTQSAFERLFGIGIAFPYPYFQKPKYKFPVYDRGGRGAVNFYGYGGHKVYQYTKFTPNLGHH